MIIRLECKNEHIDFSDERSSFEHIFGQKVRIWTDTPLLNESEMFFKELNVTYDFTHLLSANFSHQVEDWRGDVGDKAKYLHTFTPKPISMFSDAVKLAIHNNLVT